MTGSQSGIQELLRLQQRYLDVAAHLEDRKVLLERAVHPDEAEFPLAGLEREPYVPDLHGPRAVEDARTLAEHPLDGEHEIGGAIHDRPHVADSVPAFPVSGAEGRTAKARTSLRRHRKRRRVIEAAPARCRSR